MEILASRVLLRPCDFERSVEFYRDTLGLHVFREFRGGVVFFLGGGFLEVSGALPGGHPRGPGGGPADHDKLSLWGQVRDLDATHAALAGAVDVVEAPVDKPWGLREMRIRDPDGVLLVLVEVPADHPLRRDTRG